MPSDPAISEWQFRAMGTDVTVLALGGAPDLGDVAAAEIERLEAKWSRFRPASELCRLNDSAGAPTVVSRETFALVQRAVDAWRVTGGTYDPTVLPAVLATGYDRDFAAVDKAGPTPLAAGSPAPGCAGIVLDRVIGTVQLPAGVALDLGGIGKGAAADHVAELLLGAGAGGVLVNLGGDLRAVGDAPGAAAWIVDVDDPFATGATGLLAIAAGAIATSTRLRRAWTRAGQPVHHLIDPRTGLPAVSGVASVTVVAGEAWRAEVLAKAAFIAGPGAGRALVCDAGATGLFVLDDGEVLEVDGLAAYRPGA